MLIESLLKAVAIEKADFGKLQAYNAARGELTIVAKHGFSAEFLEYFGRLRDLATACTEAMRTRLRVVVYDVATDPMFFGRPSREALLREGVRAVHSTPLICKDGALVGVLSTHFRNPRRPTYFEEHQIDALARQVANRMALSAG